MTYFDHSPLRVLALTRYGRLGASSRVRSYQFEDALRAEGVALTLSPLLGDDYLRRLYAGQRIDLAGVLKDYLRRLGMLWRAGSFDLLWIEKELFPYLPAWFEYWLKWRGIRWVVDYDDAIFHNYDLARNRLLRLLRHKIDRVMRWSDAVLAGNDYLAARARAAGARRIEVVPTVIDLRRYAPLVREDADCPRIGWIGSPMTFKYLRALYAPLEALARRRSFELVVVGAEDPDLQSAPFPVRCVAWEEVTEARLLAELDIGVMPLPDDPWERGKCGYKLIQYMACGVPVVASPVGVNTRIVEPGVTGFLAGDSQAWHDSLDALLGNPLLRRTLGVNGRVRVEREYCVQVQAPRLARIFMDIAGKRC